MLIRISPKEPTLEITDWPLAICLAMPKADNVRWGSGAKLPNLLWKQASASHGNRLKMALSGLSLLGPMTSVFRGTTDAFGLDDN
jgi:hypothetical protein